IKSLSGNMNEDKIKKDLEKIETINIELDHRVSKLIAENKHLKQTYKQLYDSIKPVGKSLVTTALKDDLRKLKGKALVDNAVMKHTIDPEMLKNDVEPITPKLLNKKTAHAAYIKHTQEEVVVLRDLVEHVKANYPLDHSLESTCRYTKLIQELLTNIRVKPSTSPSGSQPSGNTKKDKIQQTQSSTQKNKVEAHPRKVKSSLKNKNSVVEPNVLKSVSANKKEPINLRSIVSDVPSTSLLYLPLYLYSSKLFSVKFKNDHVAKILGYGDYHIGNVTISRVYYDSLSRLNFGAINHLARHGLVRCLPKLKFEKDHMCSACAMGKSKKKPHKPKSEDTNHEKLYLLHMDLCGPICVASVNRKKYILVIGDDYSQFTWVKCLTLKDEALDFIVVPKLGSNALACKVIVTLDKSKLTMRETLLRCFTKGYAESNL
ncbi:retrovirus-related pol polyprotein from transposon TNT 1-94, partial [Tanacetum coccineum]